MFLKRAGVTQLVECDLAKVDVAGSNPVSRSIPSGDGFVTNGKNCAPPDTLHFDTSIRSRLKPGSTCMTFLGVVGDVKQS